MSDDEEALSVDDIISAKVAAQLGEALMVTSAVLIVETVSENGRGLRTVRSEGLPSWHTLGLLRSVLLRTEEEDIAGWTGDDEDE